MSGGRGRVLRGAFGIAISVFALALAVRQVDLAQTARIVSAAVPAWLAVMLVFQAIDVSLRGLRWQRLLLPIQRLPYSRTLEYTLVGYLANSVLPARLGELVRSHYLGDREGVSRTTTLGTVVVERVVDTGVLVVIASVAILILHVRGVVASAVLVGGALSGLLVVGLGLVLVAHRLPGADGIIAAVQRRPRVHAIGLRLRGGLAVAARPRTLAEAIVLSILAWGATVVSMAAAGQSIGVQLTTAQAALIAAGIALATAIPSGPGYLGTFELAGVTIGSGLGISTANSFALAVIAHASVLLVTSVAGSVAFVRVWRRPKSGTETAAEVGEAPVADPVVVADPAAVSAATPAVVAAPAPVSAATPAQASSRYPRAGS